MFFALTLVRKLRNRCKGGRQKRPLNTAVWTGEEVGHENKLVIH